MKRVLSLLLCLMMVLPVVFAIPSYAAEDVVLNLQAPDFKNGVTISAEGVKGLVRKNYFGFKDVDLTGINSITLDYYSNMDRNN